MRSDCFDEETQREIDEEEQAEECECKEMVTLRAGLARVTEERDEALKLLKESGDELVRSGRLLDPVCRAETAERRNAELEAERGCSLDREFLGRLVRKIWVDWAINQKNPKASWLSMWDELTEPEKEVDRLIGEGIAAVCVSPHTLLAEQAAETALAQVARLREVVGMYPEWMDSGEHIICKCCGATYHKTLYTGDHIHAPDCPRHSVIEGEGTQETPKS